MAALPESAEWVDDVYQLEENDPVLGGAPNEATGAGMDNIPHMHLAKRTSWLKAQVEALQGLVVSATTTAAGIVRLNNTLTSTATDQALTAAQGKALQDAKAPLASPSLTGTPTAPTPASGDESTRIATTAWVRAAMATIASAAGFAVSLSETGYIMFPSWMGGLVIQWGSSGSVGSESAAAITLPITFPTAAMVGLVSIRNTATNDDAWARLQSLTTTTINVRSEQGPSASLSGTRYIDFIAIGY